MLGSGCAIQDSRVAGHKGPTVFPGEIDPAKDELAGILGIVPAPLPYLRFRALLGADDLTRRLGALGRQQLAVTVVDPDDVKRVGQPIVKIMAGIGSE